MTIMPWGRGRWFAVGRLHLPVRTRLVPGVLAVEAHLRRLHLPMSVAWMNPTQEKLVTKQDLQGCILTKLRLSECAVLFRKFDSP